MKIAPFNSLVWGSLTLAPITLLKQHTMWTQLLATWVLWCDKGKVLTISKLSPAKEGGSNIQSLKRRLPLSVGNTSKQAKKRRVARSSKNSSSNEQSEIPYQSTSTNHTSLLIYPGLYLTLVGLVWRHAVKYSLIVWNIHCSLKYSWTMYEPSYDKAHAWAWEQNTWPYSLTKKTLNTFTSFLGHHMLRFQRETNLVSLTWGGGYRSQLVCQFL